ncbi:unnamed protein product, partial [Scytosiphon promiscuus]
MGNKSSVSPNESDHVRKGKQSKAKQGQKGGSKPKAPDEGDSLPKAPRPRRSDNGASSATKAAQVIPQAPAEADKISEVASTPQKSIAVPAIAVHSKERAPNASSGRPEADGGSDLARDRDGVELAKTGKSEKNKVAEGRRKTAEKHEPEKLGATGSSEHTAKRSREETPSEETTTGSSDGDSYTSSSYSSESDASDDDDASDDTFFVPKERESLDREESDG